jgi:hypothetical protein
MAETTAWPRLRQRGRCNGVAETTRRRDVMVVMVAYCCSVPRCHLLQYILTWLLFYYRCDLIYVLRHGVICCHGSHAHCLRNDIYLGHGIFFATAVIVAVSDVGHFMAQMTADGRDGAVDCRVFGHISVAFSRIWSHLVASDTS